MVEYSAHPLAEETLFEVLAEVAGSCTGCALAASHRIGKASATPPRWPRSRRTTGAA